MMHHLYKEPQDGNECTPNDWKQTDIIRDNLQAEYAKKCFQPPYEEGLGLIFISVMVLYTVAVCVVSSLVTVWWVAK